MTPVDVRQALSQLLVLTVATETMRNIPSMVSDEALEGSDFVKKLTSAFPKEQFQYKPTNTLGLLVDRVYVELETDTPSEEDLYTAFETVMADEHAPVGVTVRSLGRKLASSLSSAYRLFVDAVIPSAEDVVTLVTQKIATESALGGGTEKTTHATTFNWGLLDDPMVVQQAVALGQEKAAAFLPEQPVRHFHITGCHGAALRYASKGLPASQRAELSEALAQKLGDQWEVLKPYASAIGSAEGFNYYANQCKTNYHTARGALDAARDLTNLYQLSEAVSELVHSNEAFGSDNLRAAAADFGSAVLLMTAALQAARSSLYQNSVVMASDGTADHVESIVFNSDMTPLMAANNIGSQDAINVAEYIASEGMRVSDRGIDLPTMVGIKDRSLARKEQREAAALQKRMAGESVEFGQLVRKALMDSTTDFQKVYKTNHRGMDVGKEISRIAARAVAQEGSLFDDVVRFNVQIVNNPALNRLFTCLEAASADDQSSEAHRTEAFTRYAVATLTESAYIQ